MYRMFCTNYHRNQCGINTWVAFRLGCFFSYSICTKIIIIIRWKYVQWKSVYRPSNTLYLQLEIRNSLQKSKSVLILCILSWTILIFRCVRLNKNILNSLDYRINQTKKDFPNGELTSKSPSLPFVFRDFQVYHLCLEIPPPHIFFVNFRFLNFISLEELFSLMGFTYVDFCDRIKQMEVG